MIIEHIKLINYRQYKELTIPLGVAGGNRNISIIEGDTGAGKSTLFNAITWCLYGKETLMVEKSKGLPLINTETLFHMKDGENSSVEVEIQLVSNDDSRRYKIKRTAWLQKNSDGSAEIINDKYLSNQSDGSKLELFVHHKKAGKDVRGEFREPERRINQLLPEKINEYFFFDGERLDGYFKDTSGEKIREAVFKISQLELIDRMIHRIDTAKGTFTKTSKDLTPKVKVLREQKEEFLKTQEELVKDRDKHIEARKIALANRNEINKYLRESGVENVSKRAEERDKLNADMSELEEEFTSIDEEHIRFLMETAPMIFMYNASAFSSELIGKRKESGELPPRYRKSFLEGLLKEKECICGTKFTKDDKLWKRLESVMESCDDTDEICAEIIELGGNLQELKSSIHKFKKQNPSYVDRLNKKETQITEKNKRLKEIQEEIKGCDIEKIRAFEEKLEAFDSELCRVDEKIGELKTQIKGAGDRISRIESDITEEVKKESKLSEIKKIYLFCEKALDIAQGVKEAIMEETRKEIEERTKEQFLDIIWKKENYKDVKISDNYTIMVYDQEGRPALATLSAGEREALALSLMAALNEVSGFDVPIVIDTPLGRIAQKQRMNIADCLPKLFNRTQVTLLVTDTEYTPEVRDRLKKFIWKEYKIAFHEGKHGSEAEVLSYEK